MSLPTGSVHRLQESLCAGLQSHIPASWLWQLPNLQEAQLPLLSLLSQDPAWDWMMGVLLSWKCGVRICWLRTGGWGGWGVVLGPGEPSAAAEAAVG